MASSDGSGGGKIVYSPDHLRQLNPGGCKLPAALSSVLAEVLSTGSPGLSPMADPAAGVAPPSPGGKGDPGSQSRGPEDPLQQLQAAAAAACEPDGWPAAAQLLSDAARTVAEEDSKFQLCRPAGRAMVAAICSGPPPQFAGDEQQWAARGADICETAIAAAAQGHAAWAGQLGAAVGALCVEMHNDRAKEQSQQDSQSTVKASFNGELYNRGLLTDSQLINCCAELLGLPRSQDVILARTPCDADLFAAASTMLAGGRAAHERLPALVIAGLFDRLAHFQQITQNEALGRRLQDVLEARNRWAHDDDVQDQREPPPPPSPHAGRRGAPGASSPAAGGPSPRAGSPLQLRASAEPFTGVGGQAPNSIIQHLFAAVRADEALDGGNRPTLNPSAPAFVPPGAGLVPPPPPPPPHVPAQRRQEDPQRRPTQGRRRDDFHEDAKSRTVYVVGIDTALSERDLFGFLSLCGRLSKIRLCGDTANRTIYGFFEFQTRAEAQNLINKDKTNLGKFILNCSWAKSAIRDTMSGSANNKVRQYNFTDGKFNGEESSTALRESCLQQPNWTPKPGTRPRDHGQQMMQPVIPYAMLPAQPLGGRVRHGPPPLMRVGEQRSQPGGAPLGFSAGPPRLVRRQPANGGSPPQLAQPTEDDDDDECAGDRDLVDDTDLFDQATVESAKELLTALSTPIKSPADVNEDAAKVRALLLRFGDAVQHECSDSCPLPQDVVVQALRLALTEGDTASPPRLLTSAFKASRLSPYLCWAEVVDDLVRTSSGRHGPKCTRLWETVSGSLASCVQEGLVDRGKLSSLCRKVATSDQWFDFSNKLTGALVQIGLDYSEIMTIIPPV